MEWTVGSEPSGSQLSNTTKALKQYFTDYAVEFRETLYKYTIIIFVSRNSSSQNNTLEDLLGD